MSAYRVEILLGATFAALLAVFCYWQAPGDKLSTLEVEAYIALFDKTLPVATEEKAAFLASHRAWGLADDGKPIQMLNLMRYHDASQPQPGIEIKASTPQEANAIYERAVVPMVLAAGGYPVTMSDLPKFSGLAGRQPISWASSASWTGGTGSGSFATPIAATTSSCSPIRDTRQ